MNLKLLIDTGSSRCFLNNKTMNNYYSKYQQTESFDVITTHAISTHKKVVKIPLFEIFNVEANSTCKS
jgi:hypothetical protein